MNAGRIGSAYRHLVSRWLDRLVEQGALGLESGQYVATVALERTAAGDLWERASREFVDNQPLLDYFRHCCALAGPVLTGEESPLELLFPDGSFELAQGLYERSTTMRYINDLAASAFEVLGALVPLGRRLRVLEVGAGTGGTTQALLPLLPAGRTKYVYSDVSSLFFEHASLRFKEFPFIEYRGFDVDREPEEQGFASGSFDVIVSANAVHASVDLRAALQRLRRLLAPGGVLVLVESTTHFAWFDITTGLIEGWQHFADDLRDDNPLLPAVTWLEALQVAGFEHAEAWPRADSTASQLGQHVIVARVAGEALGSSARASDELRMDSSNEAAPGRAEPKVQELRQRFDDATVGERRDLLRDFVLEQVMAVLRLQEPPSRSHRLMDLGFDSLMAVQLRNRLTNGLGLERRLPASTMFDYPTVEALADWLLQLLQPTESASNEPKASSSQETLGVEAVAAMSDAEVEAALLKRLGDT